MKTFPHIEQNFDFSKPRGVKKIDVIVLAASVGGVKALGEVLSALPATLPVPVLIVQHRSLKPPNLLAQVLGRKTGLRVKFAEEGESLREGTVYLALPDKHLFIHQDHTLGFVDGVKIRHLLSSANPLFTFAAAVFKQSVIAVVLTGGDSDATEGVRSVKAAGGVVIAQDEATSECFSMPKSAIHTGCVDYILPLNEIGPALRHWVDPRDKESSCS